MSQIVSVGAISFSKEFEILGEAGTIPSSQVKEA